jgi:hypothetical protein
MPDERLVDIPMTVREIRQRLLEQLRYLVVGEKKYMAYDVAGLLFVSHGEEPCHDAAAVWCKN